MAVEKGDVSAMYNLALLYKNMKKDIVTAEKYYLMAAEKGEALAMGNLAHLYFEINNVNQKEGSCKWIKKAIEIESKSNIKNLLHFISEFYSGMKKP